MQRRNRIPAATTMMATLAFSTLFATVASARAANTNTDDAQQPARAFAGWPQLPLSPCQVDEFLRTYPESDGRGVVIAVLDTGVDPGIPGLTHLPNGETKVIDVQDFSGEGDTDVLRARASRDDNGVPNVIAYEDGNEIHYKISPRIAPDPNAPEPRRYWMGTLDEKRFVNSSVPDINDNGKTDDKFAILVTALQHDGDDQAICFVDTDMDRDFTDEKPLLNYRIRQDSFTFQRRKPEIQIEPLTICVNIFLRQSKVVFHFDDGAHGTHVAGIAAGYNINNQPGFNGIAPGARLMSLKIGNNAIGGISTTDAKKKALEYAIRYAREHNVHVVCNLSFGVSATLEGDSDLEKFLDEKLADNQMVTFCTSAGNEGPGLSSVGNPATAREVLSIGALLAPAPAREVMGFSIDNPVPTVFSSRGAESGKPDIATPGWETSTVPRWVRGGDYWAGTSMACPYATGLAALLISHNLNPKSPMPASDPSDIRSTDVRQALRLSAEPLAGFSQLDDGYGLPGLIRAAALFDRLRKSRKNDPVVAYDISTDCPNAVAGKAAAMYYRSTYIPTKRRHAFTIKPIFAAGIDADQKTGFTRKFQLRAAADWINLTQGEFYLRSSQSATVFVELDGSELEDSGVYTSYVSATYDGLEAFRLPVTIVRPEQLSPADDYAATYSSTVHGWHPRRYFIAVPPGGSALVATLTAPDGEDAKIDMQRIYDPAGQRHRIRSNVLNTDNGKRKVQWRLDDELMPGVWEFDVVSNRPDRDWDYELAFRFFGMHADPAVIKAGDTSGEVTITNMFTHPLPGQAEGVIEGFRQHKKDQWKGLDDELTYTIKLGANDKGGRIRILLKPEHWAEVTDLGVTVLQGDKAIYDSAMETSEFHGTFNHPAPGSEVSLTLRLTASFAVSDDKRETPVHVDIDHLLSNPIEMKIRRGDDSSMQFLPGVPMHLTFSPTGDLPEAPADTKPVGYLRIQERGSDETALHIPLGEVME